MPKNKKTSLTWLTLERKRMITEENKQLFQGAFDKAVRGILAQGRRSFSIGNGVCLYRSGDGCKCAVGHLISDEEYNKEFESLGAINLIERFEISSLKPFCFKEGFDFIGDLQSVHDYAKCDHNYPERDVTFLASFKERAKDFAKKYNLNTSVLDEQND